MSFTKFLELAPELRFKIWDEALRQEMEDRLILVHCATMRVIPHPSARSLVMNANHEPRNHARTFYYDVKLKVWTAEVGGLSVPSEIIEFTKTSSGRAYTRDTHPRSAHQGLVAAYLRLPVAVDRWMLQLRHELETSVRRLLATQSRQSGHRRPRRQGWIFVSSQHDRFALAGTTRTDSPSWNGNSIGLCEKAFLRDYVCGPTREAMQAPMGLPSPSALQCDGVVNNFQARHMADRLPQPVQTRIRHVGACFLYTGYMDTIPAGKDLLGPNKLVEWKKSGMDNGRLAFTCLCKNTKTCGNAADRGDDTTAQPESALEDGEDVKHQTSTGANEVHDG
ncbi:hypothetical protein PG985_009589 [Apiospora marii]|uniref:2EXR domain-containing protein n=1 Tax=Apiospora marii TaxID=335849 RepID=A0ABR1RFR3_9PEZI